MHDIVSQIIQVHAGFVLTSFRYRPQASVLSVNRILFLVIGQSETSFSSTYLAQYVIVKPTTSSTSNLYFLAPFWSSYMPRWSLMKFLIYLVS